MNNSISSLSTGSASYLTNPLKEDPELKTLFKELEATVTSKKEFELWRNSFLNRFIEFLDVESTEHAEQAYWKFSDTMSIFVRFINKLNKHMDDNNISPTHCSVKARQCLQEVSRHITIVNDEVDRLLPGTMSMEKEVGFTKFHIGAVLVRDGFREYARMSMCADVIEKMEKALKDVADKLILLNMSSYIYKLNTFCDVMADLGLLSALLKCSEYIDADDDDEEPIKLSKLIEKMVNDDKNGTEIEYPSLDLNSSITLLDRSNKSMNYEEEENAPIPQPSSQDLVLYGTTNSAGTNRPEASMVPYIQSSGRPRGNSCHSFDSDSSITLYPTTEDSNIHPKPLPTEFAPRESAPYEYVAPSSTSTTTLMKPSKDVVDRELARPKRINSAGPAIPKKPSKTNKESVKPPIHPKPPVVRRLSSSSSSVAAPNKSAVTKDDVHSPAATESDRKPSIGGRVRWNPVKYYNNIKKKSEGKKVEQADAAKKDSKDPGAREESRKVTKDSDITDDKTEEPERKGLRSLFQRKPTSKPSPSDAKEIEKVKESPIVAESKSKNGEEKDIPQPGDDDDDDDDEKPVQRRRKKWSLNDIYNRLANNKKESKKGGDVKSDAKVEVQNDAPKDDLLSQTSKKHDSQVASVSTHEPEMAADDVSESSTMVSENEEPVKQVNSSTTIDSKSSKQPSLSGIPVNDDNQKERKTKKEQYNTTTEKASSGSKKTNKQTDIATSNTPVQPEKVSTSNAKQVAKPNKQSKKPATKQAAVKNDIVTSKSSTEPEKPLTKAKTAAKSTNPPSKHLDNPSEPTSMQKPLSEKETTSASSMNPEKPPSKSKKITKESDLQVKKPEKSLHSTNEPSAGKKDTHVSRPEKRSGEVQKHAKNIDVEKVPASPREPVKEMNNASLNKTSKVNNSKNADASNAPPDVAAAKPKQQKKKTKHQLEKEALDVEQNIAKAENGSGTPEQEAEQTTKSKKKKQTENSPKSRVKSLLNRPNKKSNPQPGEIDEAVTRDRTTKSTTQNKPWDGVSTKLKEPWDEKYTKKTKDGKGNEPLAICAAPPEDDDEDRRIGTGGAPLLAICAAEPEEDEIGGGNGKPLLAICAAEPEDDNYDADSVSEDDVSESETMASDDEEEENGISESDASESKPAVSELDTMSANGNNNDHDNMVLEGSAATQDIEDHTIQVSPVPHSLVDDVSESETAASDDEDGGEVGEISATSMATQTTKDEQHTPTCLGASTSNQSIATNTNALNEKADVAKSQRDTTDATIAKPDSAAKKGMKILTDEERRKCYMWYDRLGRPPRDKMKQRISTMKDCDITIEDVDALPWMMRGTMISQSELNKLILK